MMTLRRPPRRGFGEQPATLAAIQNLFARGELGGYWPTDPQYAYEDSEGTTLASVDGVVGYRTDVALGKHAIQATTGNKPYLRRTPNSNKPWYDSNTATGALNVTFSSSLGSACTIATLTPEGVVIAENKTVGTTYNIAPPYGYNSDVLIINRALTAAEKALVTRVFSRNMPGLGSELVTNGGFDADITGYINANAARGSISWESGRLKMDAVSGNGTAMYAYTACTTSTGLPYCVKYSYSSSDGGASYVNLGGVLTFGASFSNKTALLSIVPTGGSVSISLYSSTYKIGYIDNLTVKAIL